MLFLLALKWNLWEKAFSNVKTKTNPNFAVKLAGRSNHLFLLSIWWITFQTFLLLMRDIQCIIELNWLCEHIKKIDCVIKYQKGQKQPTVILVLNWIKHSFSLGVSLSWSLVPRLIRICRIYLYIYLFIYLFVYLFIYLIRYLQSIKRIVLRLIYIG